MPLSSCGVSLTPERLFFHTDRRRDHDFAPAWAEYLTGYQDLKINTIADIVSFNKSHEMGWPQSDLLSPWMSHEYH
jgi:hypothetical protein